MPLAREKVAAYHRARRARIKAEKEAIVARGGRPTFTTHEPGIFGYRDGNKPKPRRTAPSSDKASRSADRNQSGSAAPSVHVIAPPASPPRSMLAIGGKPGRGLVPQGRGMALPPDLAAVSQFSRFQENTLAMLAALAARVDAQEQEIAALKAADADRKANAINVAGAFFNLIRVAIGG